MQTAPLVWGYQTGAVHSSRIPTGAHGAAHRTSRRPLNGARRAC